MSSFARLSFIVVAIVILSCHVRSITAASGSNVSNASSTTPLAAYIAAGLGGTPSLTFVSFPSTGTAVSTANHTTYGLQNATSPITHPASSVQLVRTSSTGLASPVGNHTSNSYHNSSATGTPSNSLNASMNADACQSALLAYTSSSTAYESDHLNTISTQFSFWATSTISGYTHATKLTTLCDGHPRVVGEATWISQNTRTTTEWTTTTVTITSQESTYTGNAPSCSIGTAACDSMWSIWTSTVSQITASLQAAGIPHFDYTNIPPEPQCMLPTTTASPGSTTTSGYNSTCDGCEIVADEAKLLYWPVMTVSGSGDLCNGNAITVPGSQTGAGPNTFVTAGLTITSPTVAVSFGGLQRADGCGSTVAHTIIPVPPDQVYSIEGYHIFATALPFDYANLNLQCMNNSTDRNDCFTAVPARAYFNGLQVDQIVGAEDLNTAGLTIYDNYAPRMYPPVVMMTAISSIWGSYCTIQVDGVWDPPVAMSQESTVAAPKVTWASSTTSFVSASTPAAPAETRPTQASMTTSPQATGGSSISAEPDLDPNASSTAASSASVLKSSQSTPDAANPTASSPDGTDSPNGVLQTTVSPTSFAPSATTGNGRAPTTQDPQNPVKPSGVAPDSSAATVKSDILGLAITTDSAGTEVLALGSATITASDMAAVPGSPAASVDPAASVVSNGNSVVPLAGKAAGVRVVSAGSLTVTIAPQSSGEELIADAQTTVVLSPDGRATSIGSDPISEASAGDLVFGSGAGAMTVSAANGAVTDVGGPGQGMVVTLGSLTLTDLPQSNGAQLLANDVTTFTVSPGGAATSVGTEVVSAASAGGLVVGTGTAANTIPIMPSAITNNIVTLGSHVYTMLAGSDGAYILEDATTTAIISSGGSAVVLDSQTVSEIPGGLVVQSGGSKTTLGVSAIPAGQSTSAEHLVTLGSQVYTMLGGSNGVFTLEDATTTAVVSPGGSAVVLDAETVSALPSGLAIQSGSLRITLDPTSLAVVPASTNFAPSTAKTTAVSSGCGTAFVPQAVVLVLSALVLIVAYAV